MRPVNLKWASFQWSWEKQQMCFKTHFEHISPSEFNGSKPNQACCIRVTSHKTGYEPTVQGRCCHSTEKWNPLHPPPSRASRYPPTCILARFWEKPPKQWSRVSIWCTVSFHSVNPRSGAWMITEPCLYSAANHLELKRIFPSSKLCCWKTRTVGTQVLFQQWCYKLCSCKQTSKLYCKN